MTNEIERVRLALLERFAAAWNRHDIDALMDCMSDDCVFESAAGPEVCGTRFVGRDAVRAAFAQAWTTFPDAQWRQGSHFVFGERGLSQWIFTGTRVDGASIEADGCDLFAFKNDRIAVKSAFRKDRPLAAPRSAT